MTIRIDLKGADQLRAALENMTDDVRRYVGEEVGDVAAELEGDVVLGIMQGPATGRIYKRGGVSHQASAPGEAPMSDTGTLAGSVYSEKETDLTYNVGSRLARSLYLEVGTTRMAPRPIWAPMAEKHRAEFHDRIAGAIKRATT